MKVQLVTLEIAYRTLLDTQAFANDRGFSYAKITRLDAANQLMAFLRDSMVEVELVNGSAECTPLA